MNKKIIDDWICRNIEEYDDFQKPIPYINNRLKSLKRKLKSLNGDIEDIMRDIELLTEDIEFLRRDDDE